MKRPELRNPLHSPQLAFALSWLQPSPAPRLIEHLVRSGRADAAAAIVEQLIADADRP